VKIIEKSRRIGISYAEAADDVLYAASAEGANVYYISYNKDMTAGFINDCATWAKAFNAAAGQIEESLIEIEDKQILTYTIKFDSGHMIQAFTSNPRNLRSKGRPGERLLIDEAAFVDDIQELLKAAMAMTMWGPDPHHQHARWRRQPVRRTNQRCARRSLRLQPAPCHAGRCAARWPVSQDRSSYRPGMVSRSRGCLAPSHDQSLPSERGRRVVLHSSARRWLMADARWSKAACVRIR
jgi:hypothetical protein